MKNVNVAVAMSGGVDSSVAAALLIEQGYRVTGVTMKLWDGDDTVPDGIRHSCYGPGESLEIEKTKKVAETLGIPLYIFDVSADFRRNVLDYCSREYLNGRTPNPCVMCNRHIKFEALLNQAKKANPEFDYFATGHYCRTALNPETGRYLLKKGKDEKKDQSYFLAFLTQEQLSRTMFPVGEYTKTEVRDMAERFRLDMQEKPESQDFIAAGYRSVIGEGKPGIIVDQEGAVLGEHQGIANFTIGQRKGLGISYPEPLYVTDINADNGTVTVGTKDAVYSTECTVSGLNWIAIEPPEQPLALKVKIRHMHREADAEVTPEGETARIIFREPQMAVTPGQAAVFYNGDNVTGAGIIERTTDHG